MLPLAIALIAVHALPIPINAESPPDTLTVSIDFPGGSGEVLDIDQEARTIRLVPTPHRDRGWSCWWYVRVDGIRCGDTIAIDIGNAPWATPDRAAFSTDNRRWVQTAQGTRDGKRIVYRQRVDSETAWFAWGPPFVPEDAWKLCERAAAACPEAEAFMLCRTRGGRDVPALHVTPPNESRQRPYGIWVQARQHAWESGSSWVCQGFMEWLVSDDERARTLRSKSLLTVIPIMDIDNVAIGAGGKGQKPQDHNRDWSDEPHWASVAAAQREIRNMNEAHGCDLFIDLHNPGANTKNPYFYITPRNVLSEVGNRNLDRFLRDVKQDMTGPLAFRGKTIESGAAYDKALWKRISKNWVVLNCRQHVVAVTLETAWNTPHGTTEGYLTVGRQLGLAIERYLGQDPRKSQPAPRSDPGSARVLVGACTCSWYDDRYGRPYGPGRSNAARRTERVPGLRRPRALPTVSGGVVSLQVIYPLKASRSWSRYFGQAMRGSSSSSYSRQIHPR